MQLAIHMVTTMETPIQTQQKNQLILLFKNLTKI
jgi:hypothetical protein